MTLPSSIRRLPLFSCFLLMTSQVIRAQQATIPPTQLSQDADLPQAAVAAAGAPAIPDEAVMLLGGPPVEQLPKPITPAPAIAPDSPATSVTLNLLKLMVAKKLLSQEEAEALISQAQAEAEVAKSQLLEDAALAHADPGDVRVTYIPENVKQELREEIRGEVMDKARDEKWLDLPDEKSDNIEWFGDLRMRYRGDLLANQGNDNSGAFPNFNQLNTGRPYDTAGNNFSPQNNVDQDRYTYQLRARAGLEASLEDGWFIGAGIGTGENNSPVTQNQSLGTTINGQGGNFSKYSIWLDRAYARYEMGSELGDNVNLFLGRYNNPFMSTEMMWDEDLGFDGLAMKGRRKLGRSTVFGTLGAFPIFNSDFNFAVNQPSKVASNDKYLYGAQLGIQFALAEKVTAKIAAAYYDFDSIEGRLSSPFVPLSDQDIGDTDESRPSFAQRGNTYRPIRYIPETADNKMGTINQFQYYGLASKFRDIDLNARVDFDLWEPYRLSLIADYVKNTAWNSSAIDKVAVNNRGPSPATNVLGSYEGGDTAFMLRAEFGRPKFEKRGDWSTWVDYRYVESDAMPDAFTDSDFGGGGTNFEGFSLGASVALSRRVRMAARWMSTSEIAGPPLSHDIFMFDFTAEF